MLELEASKSSYLRPKKDNCMKNVGIICGGFSSEFEISVLSGTNIQKNFPDEYRAFLVLLRETGWTVKIEDEEIPMDAFSFTFIYNGEKIGIDVGIVYIHGDPGENGKVQAYLEMIKIPYVNSGPLASQLSFDKWFCNQFIRGFGVNVAKSLYLTSPEDLPDVDEVVAEYGLPLFVKPCDSGSSYGIAKVKEPGELKAAVKNAFDEGNTIIIESFLDGTEVTCGVYKNKDGVQAMPLVEIVSHNEFFDYEAKYQGLSEEIVPARISAELTAKVQEIAVFIYKLLRLRSIARVDFMLVGDVPHVIEVNTTPGFSNESIVPKMIGASNITVKEFWSQIMEAEL